MKKRTLTSALIPDNESTNNREKKHKYFKNNNHLVDKLNETAFEFLNKFENNETIVPFIAGGKAWEKIYNNTTKPISFQSYNYDFFIYAQADSILPILLKAEEYYNNLYTFVIKENLKNKIITFRTGYKKNKNNEIFLLTPEPSILKNIPSYELRMEIIVNDIKIDLLYIVIFPTKIKLNLFKNAFNDNYLEDNYLNANGLYLFMNQLKTDRTFDKGINIDKIRMDYLIDNYDNIKNIGYGLYNEVFQKNKVFYNKFVGIDLYHNKMLTLEIQNAIESIKKKSIKSFRNICFNIINDINMNLPEEYKKKGSVAFLVGGEAMSYYGITNQDDTNDFDVKLIIRAERLNQISAIKKELNKYISDILIKYVFLLNNPSIFDKEQIFTNDVLRESNKQNKSISRIRFHNNLTHNNKVELYSIDINYFAEYVGVKSEHSLKIEIPIFDLVIHYITGKEVLANNALLYPTDDNLTCTHFLPYSVGGNKRKNKLDSSPSNKKQKRMIPPELLNVIINNKLNQLNELAKLDKFTEVDIKLINEMNIEYVELFNPDENNILPKMKKSIDEFKNLKISLIEKIKKSKIKELKIEESKIEESKIEEIIAREENVDDEEFAKMFEDDEYIVCNKVLIHPTPPSIYKELDENHKLNHIYIANITYLLNDYHIIYNNALNKKMRLIAGKNKKDEDRYNNIKKSYAKLLNYLFTRLDEPLQKKNQTIADNFIKEVKSYENIKTFEKNLLGLKPDIITEEYKNIASLITGTNRFTELDNILTENFKSQHKLYVKEYATKYEKIDETDKIKMDFPVLLVPMETSGGNIDSMMMFPNVTILGHIINYIYNLFI